MADVLGSGLPDVNWSVVPAGVRQWQALMEAAGTRYGISPALLAAVATEESGGVSYAVSPAGAIGIMQIMPFNANGANLYDPQTNINLGASILVSDIRANGNDLTQGLESYNGGSYRGPDTLAYAQRVEGDYARYTSGVELNLPPVVTLPPADTSESFFAQFLPQSTLAWQSFQSNVNELLPHYYGAIVYLEQTLRGQSGGSLGYYQ